MIANKPTLRNIDYTLVLAVLAICAIGVFAIKSATHLDKHPLDFVHKQIFGVAVGAAAMLAMAASEYDNVLRRWVVYLYPLNIVLLALVAFGHLGHSSHGAQRWISLGPIQIQPSEFSKIILICSLAIYVAENIETIGQLPTLLKSFVHVGVPMVLIAKQPDLGTALVILAIWFGVVAVAGARVKHLAALLLIGTVLFAGMWQFHVLKDYQKNRLEVFLNPNADPRDSGYHLHQSEIAIGSGENTGEGYLKGSQSNGGFIPEQHTDFIFTVIGEEGGFVTCVVLFALYLFVLERGVKAMAECEDVLGRLLAAGVISMLTFHTVVNAGMTMGIMPVVGVPLPCVSYGLSNLFVTMLAVGLLLSVSARKRRVIF